MEFKRVSSCYCTTRGPGPQCLSMCHANFTPMRPLFTLLLSPFLISPRYSACPDLTQVPHLFMEFPFTIAAVLSCLPQSLYVQFNINLFIR